MHMDQGAPGYALTWYMSYHLRLRTLAIPDVFHRQWTDATNGFKGAGLWWVVVLTSVVYNFSYGPWESHGWYQKCREGGP